MKDFDEILSAAQDGECSPVELDRLLEACAQSPELLRRFGRQCASREARAGTRFNFDSEALCAAVMSQVTPAPHARVVALRSHVKTVLRPVTGLALAASLGALATFGVYRLQVTAPTSIAATASAGSGAVADVAGGGAAATVGGGAPVSDVRWAQLAPSTARQLDDFMLEHASYRSAQGMSSALDYARMAAQENPFDLPDRGPAAGQH